MTEAISEQARLSRERRSVERTSQRLRLYRVELAAGIVLVVSTVFAWMNHPRVERVVGHPRSTVVREVGHSIGLVTRPAGLLALGLGAIILLWARKLRGGSRSAGWMALVLGLGALGVCVAEIDQLLLGRRNWLDHLTTGPTVPSPLAHAVGAGAWLATAASVASVALAGAYLWRVYGSWKDGPTRTP